MTRQSNERRGGREAWVMDCGRKNLLSGERRGVSPPCSDSARNVIMAFPLDSRPLGHLLFSGATNRGCGGIGRRARFRFLCPQGRGGSTPLIRRFWSAVAAATAFFFSVARSASNAFVDFTAVGKSKAMTSHRTPNLECGGLPPLSFSVGKVAHRTLCLIYGRMEIQSDDESSHSKFGVRRACRRFLFR